MKKSNNERARMLLNTAIGKINNFSDSFVAYNTKFLGLSKDDVFIINGEDVSNSTSTHEFCFGYDSNGDLQLINVYKTKKGQKYAAQELFWSLYGYWLIEE